MIAGDVVMLMRNQFPVLGEVVSFTPKRVRIALRLPSGYYTVLRAESNVQVVKKYRGMK